MTRDKPEMFEIYLSSKQASQESFWNNQPLNLSNHISNLKSILHPCSFYWVEVDISQNADGIQFIRATAGSQIWLKLKPKLL